MAYVSTGYIVVNARHDANAEQRECAVYERGNDHHEAGDGYLESGGPSKLTGVGNQCYLGTTSSGPGPTVHGRLQ